MSETPHKTKDDFDEQITHCTHCGAIDDPSNNIRLRLISYDDSYSEIVCNICVPESEEQ